jgi:PBP1b-binding outer membrane lipoprotein LpoB
MKRLTAIAAACILLTGCSSPGTPDSARVPDGSTATEPAAPTETPTATEPARAEVKWEDYDATVQTGIDQMTTAGDCVGLQGQFDAAEANNLVTLDRTGHGNSALMAYIDESLHLASCY